MPSDPSNPNNYHNLMIPFPVFQCSLSPLQKFIYGTIFTAQQFGRPLSVEDIADQVCVPLRTVVRAISQMEKREFLWCDKNKQGRYVSFDTCIPDAIHRQAARHLYGGIVEIVEEDDEEDFEEEVTEE